MLQKLTLLNKTILDYLAEGDDLKIAKAFTEVGVKILEADFGFVWFNHSLRDEDWKLVYKYKVPFTPINPRAGGRNYKVVTSRKIYYQENLKNVPDADFLKKHMKSFVIIPISYREQAYGTIVLCFKKEETFSSEKRILCEFLGNGIAQVISSHRSRERAQQLKDTEMLLAQEKLKTEFITNATHELRTPLAIIQGNVDLAMQVGQGSEKYQKSSRATLRAITTEVRHLSDILADLALMSSKEDKMNAKIVFAKVDLKKLIKKAIARCRTLSYRKKISITASSIPDVVFVGDKAYLEKMLVNIIKNSITYGNKNGHTEIKTTIRAGFVVIEISDDGIGISKEDAPHIFERFYRADKSHTSTDHSRGLGLAIVKWIVEVHLGSVEVKSTKGKGSSFTVSLPLNIEK